MKMEESVSRRDLIKTLGVGGLALGLTSLSHGSQPKEKKPSLTESEIGYKEGAFVLPPLSYAYDSLEPYIDEQTMRLHHDKHHAGYVKGANKALKKLAEIASGQGDASLVKHWSRELAFHGSGHAMHLIFWNNMKPGGSEPEGALADALVADFGSIDGFKNLFLRASKSVEGSGWGILGYENVSRRLVVLQAEKHQDHTVQGISPLLVVDVWEHAYYLKYQNMRGDYIKAFMNVINWDDVANRYVQACRSSVA